MSQIVFIKWLECLRLCLQSSGRVSGHVYRLVGVSQVVCTQWWVCLGSCLQGGERVRSCLQGGERVRSYL